MAKRGRLSPDDIAYINDNCLLQTTKEIAHALNRTPEGIAKYLKDNRLTGAVIPVEDPSEEKTPHTIQKQLRGTEAWKQLKQEFNNDELVFFDEKYVEMMAQFKDVLATERTQIFQAIKFELLMSRNLIARREALTNIDEAEEKARQYIRDRGGASHLNQADSDYLLALQTQIVSLQHEEQSKTTEYTKLQERHDKLMESLKATRDKRLDRIESQKVDFLGVIKYLQDGDIQRVEGRQMELMKLAGQQEKISLGRPIKYDDGNMDNPILCCDTVDLEPEEEE